MRPRCFQPAQQDALAGLLFGPDEDDEPVEDSLPPVVTGTVPGLREDAFEDRRASRDLAASRYRGDADHETVQDELAEAGTIRDVEERFCDLATVDIGVQARTGSELDRRNAVRRLAGDWSIHRVHRRYETVSVGDRVLGLALDMSGSMRSAELVAKSAVGAFCHGVQRLGEEGVATAFSGSDTRLITGPREPFAWQHLDAVRPSGGTPTLLGIRDASRLIEATQAAERVLVVVTDGMPTDQIDDDFEDPEDEIDVEVDDLRRGGYHVFGVGFGNVQGEGMRRMFGEDYYVQVALEELADALADLYEAHIRTPRAPG